MAINCRGNAIITSITMISDEAVTSAVGVIIIIATLAEDSLDNSDR